ncbi:unnamed protein product [Penicillium roqueforti FM164]|uniref:Uncharacterized protein n=1 Tax=Penicillium roqueforti (strain FM164) TaxID=1365484 RepID=W6QLD9_PENRF|nr:unnamed protein product [Penicillium roqueforti FM164]
MSSSEITRLSLFRPASPMVYGLMSRYLHDLGYELCRHPHTTSLGRPESGAPAVILLIPFPIVQDLTKDNTITRASESRAGLELEFA